MWFFLWALFFFFYSANRIIIFGLLFLKHKHIHTKAYTYKHSLVQSQCVQFSTLNALPRNEWRLASKPTNVNNFANFQLCTLNLCKVFARAAENKAEAAASSDASTLRLDIHIVQPNPHPSPLWLAKHKAQPQRMLMQRI